MKKTFIALFKVSFIIAFISFVFSMVFLLAFSVPPPTDFESVESVKPAVDEKIKIISPSAGQFLEKGKQSSIVLEIISSSEAVSIEVSSVRDGKNYLVSQEAKVVKGRNQINFTVPATLSGDLAHFIVRDRAYPNIIARSEAIKIVSPSQTITNTNASSATAPIAFQSTAPPPEDRPVLSAQTAKEQGEEQLAPQTIKIFPFKPRFTTPGDKIFVQWKASTDIETIKVIYSYDNFEKTTKDLKTVPVENEFLVIKANPQLLGKTISFKIIDTKDNKVNSNVESITVEETPPLKADFEAAIKSMKAGETFDLWVRAKDKQARYIVEGKTEDKQIVLASGNLEEGFLTLKVPDQNLRKVCLRVYSQDGRLEDSSDAVFAFVVPGIEVLLPAANEKYTGGDKVFIRGQADNSVSKIKMEYSLDNFVKDTNLIVSNVENSADFVEYNWFIPEALAGDVKIRISSMSDSNVYGEVSIKVEKLDKDKASGVKAGPSPFNPAVHEKINFEYILPEDMSLELFIFDIGGQVVYKKQFASGQQGGKKGLNQVDWNGRSVLDEGIVNGIYVYTLMSNGKMLSKEKFVVMQ